MHVRIVLTITRQKNIEKDEKSLSDQIKHNIKKIVYMMHIFNFHESFMKPWLVPK